MVKTNIPPQLARGQEILALMRQGYSKEQARAIADKAAMAPKRGRPRRSGGGGGGEVQPFPGGDGIRPPGRAGSLYAKISAAPEVVFDQRALASIWEGLIDALRTRGQVDPAELFPERFPCEGNDPSQAQERAIGREMAGLLPVVLAALDVTIDEWSAWYASKATVRLAEQSCMPGMGWGQQPAAATAAPPSLPSGWGTITGAPLLTPPR